MHSENPCCFQTKMHPKFLQKLKKRAWLLTALFFLMDVVVFAFSSLSIQSFGGVFFALISLGICVQFFMPYYQVKQESQKNNQLLFTKKMLIYKVHGKNAFSIPLELIDSVCYVEKESLYGIGLSLHVPFSEKIFMRTPSFSIKTFHKVSKSLGHDLFFPYFYEEALEKKMEKSPLKELVKCRVGE